MKQVAAAFYSEPIVFLGVVQAVAAGLAGEGVIAGWIGALVVAAILPLQRHFVRPQKR